jgi:hypothetical protein
MRGKYLGVYGEYDKCRVICGTQNFLQIRRKNLCVLRTWRRRKETLGIFSYYAKRHKSAYISVNNNTNLKKIYILSIYTIWERLSQKTISRYCPFKGSMAGEEPITAGQRWANDVARDNYCILPPLSHRSI